MQGISYPPYDPSMPDATRLALAERIYSHRAVRMQDGVDSGLVNFLSSYYRVPFQQLRWYAEAQTAGEALAALGSLGRSE